MTHSSDLKKRLKAALTPTGAASSDFDLNPETAPPTQNLREAAVLVAFQDVGRGPEIVLTKRSPRLQNHPGQIAFPGGKRDANDADLAATALREAQEEIGLPPDTVTLLGTLAPHVTVTGFNVTPCVGWIGDRPPFHAETGEVSEVFCVPAQHLLTLENYAIEGRMWRRQLRRYYAVPFGPYYIWGATARMLRGLAEQVTA